MKTIFKLLVAALVINAAVRGGNAALDYYTLKDATTQLLTFGDQASTKALEAHIVEKAVELRLPVTAQNVTVHRQGVRTWANASYTQTIEFLPNYPYALDLAFQVDTYSLTPGRPED